MTGKDETFSDIATAIMGLQRAFRRHGIEPVIIELADRRQGDHLRFIADKYLRENGMTAPALGPSGLINQCEIAGTIVRWPAEYRALRSGGFDII